jgi:hypothetical protein
MSTKTIAITQVWEGSKCIRCGRNSHTKDTCYAQTDVNGNNFKPTIIVKTTQKIVETEAVVFKHIHEETSTNVEPPKSWWSKITNEFVNPDSDMRSGRFLNK